MVIQNNWTVGSLDLYEAAKNINITGQDVVLLHISTSIQSLSSLHLSSEVENELMSSCWNLVLCTLPSTIIGKRTSWRSFLFILDGKRTHAVELAARVRLALQRDAKLNKLVWRLVLSPIGQSWRQAFCLAEAEAHEVTKEAKTSILIWVEDVFGQTSVSLLH